jgi:hypothetical protein
MFESKIKGINEGNKLLKHILKDKLILLIIFVEFVSIIKTIIKIKSIEIFFIYINIFNNLTIIKKCV